MDRAQLGVPLPLPQQDEAMSFFSSLMRLP